MSIVSLLEKPVMAPPNTADGETMTSSLLPFSATAVPLAPLTVPALDSVLPGAVSATPIPATPLPSIVP